MSLPVVILAGGLAKRLRPLTESIPKSLIDINGLPFIIHQLNLLRDRGINRVILCVSYLGEKIQEVIDGKDLGIQIEFSFDGPFLLGTAGAIKKALPLLSKSFFVLYGDSYLPYNYNEIQTDFEQRNKLALMTIYKNDGRWDKSNVELSRGIILSYSKENRTLKMRYIDAGLGVFRREAFDTVPNGQPWDLEILYQNLLDQGELATHEVNERFYEIGTLNGIKEIRGII
jgi:MurNAc alpha-1-phosphate uridylyltransferase